MTLTLDAAPLADPRLLRSFAYVAGRWTAGEASATFPVTDPATGETIGHVAALDRRPGPRRHRRRRRPPSPPGRRLLPQERSAVLRRWHDADPRRPRGPRPHHDPRAGQAALRSRAARSTTPRASSSSTPRRPAARTSRASPRTCTTPRSSSGASPPASPR